MTPPPLPIPRTSHLPVFSDNVLPSLLVHLGVIDLTTSDPSFKLTSLFPDAQKPEHLNPLLEIAESVGKGSARLKEVPEEGPTLSTEQAFVLRAAAIDACDLITEVARNLGDEEIEARSIRGEDVTWLKNITPPQVDAWIWAVAKDREDYRRLERFVLRNTPYF